ncbi:MAG: hypothetical protein Q3965_01330 [Rothia sp. (in: high G+C Gram-positive bacteria)]|nr:hypothetical protein [Rothia sp. (in: high G+C Gram-positive bacteria)]
MDGMSSDLQEPPYSRLIRGLGITAGVLMVLGVTSTIVMLLLKWASGSAPQILSIIPLLFIPTSFLALLAALLFAVLRKKAS